MAEYSMFGLVVKTKLLEMPTKTQKWLVNEVNKDTGLNIDSAYISKILTGQRNSQRVKASICKILDIDHPNI